MEILLNIFIVLIIVLPIIGMTLTIGPDDNYHGQYNHIREDKHDNS